MDSPSDQYANRLKEAIAGAEVVSVFFLQVGQSLIMDLRPDAGSEPLVTLDGMVESPYQRLLSFGQLRPSLSLPDEITLAPWPDRVRAFQESGVLGVVVERCRAAGGDSLASEAGHCFDRLLVLERRALRDMIRGVGMETVWQRNARGDERPGSEP
jgi:hypothetical protein